MLAILEDAIHTCLGPVPHLQREAAEWLADRDGRWVFSFPVVCDTLGLDRDAVWAAVQLLRARNHAFGAGATISDRTPTRRRTTPPERNECRE